MTPTPCQALRHDVRPRTVGDLVGAYCATCECLCWRTRPDSLVAADVSGVRAPVASAGFGRHKAASTATTGTAG